MLTHVYKQPALKEHKLASMMKSQTACCHLSKRALLKVVWGDTVTAGEMLPAVYGLGTAMSLFALWHSGDRCSLTHTHTDSLPSLQYSMVYPSRPEAPMVSGVFHLMERLESFTSYTHTSRGALVTTEGGSNRLQINKRLKWTIRGAEITLKTPTYSPFYNMIMCRAATSDCSHYQLIYRLFSRLLI